MKYNCNAEWKSNRQIESKQGGKDLLAAVYENFKQISVAQKLKLADLAHVDKRLTRILTVFTVPRVRLRTCARAIISFFVTTSGMLPRECRDTIATFLSGTIPMQRRSTRSADITAATSSLCVSS